MRAPPRRPAAETPLNKITVARYVYLADRRREAMDDLRADINYELGYQMKRGLIRLIKSNYDIGLKGDEVTFDQLAEAGIYHLGDPDTVASNCANSTRPPAASARCSSSPARNGRRRDKVSRSMRLFMEHVAPKLARPGAGARP